MTRTTEIVLDWFPPGQDTEVFVGNQFNLTEFDQDWEEYILVLA
jgi:hypothetical protein